MKRQILLLIICVILLSSCGSGKDRSYDTTTVSTLTDNTLSSVSDETDTSSSGDTNEDGPISDPISKEAIFTECLDPAFKGRDFQKTVTFPDRLGFHNNAGFINSCVSFESYRDQGGFYIIIDEGVKSFSLYINSQKADVSNLLPGHTYYCDLSGVSVDGSNTIQVSDIFPSDLDPAIKICILYPTLLEGTPEEVGIDPEVFEIIDSIVESDVEYGFSSAQMSVIKDGKLIYENTWGYKKLYDEYLKKIDDPVKADNETLYDLASNTKMYSANYAVMHLVSEGKLRLDDRISDILGTRFYENTISVEISGKKLDEDDVKEWKKELTVNDILCHKAGFPACPKYEIKHLNLSNMKIGDEYENPLYSGCDATFANREKTLESICMTPLIYEPGSKVLYSDVDYMLLSFIVEEVSGTDFQTYLKESFYDPLSLDHITFRPLDNGFSKNDCAATELIGNTRDGLVDFDGIRRYTLQGEVHDEMAYYSMAGVSGHAGLFANSSDLAKLAYVMLSGGYEDVSFFSEDVIDCFTSPSDPDNPEWGIGWWRNADDQRPWYFGSVSNNTFGHQGWTGTLTVIDPDNDMVIVYLTNKIHSPLINPLKNSGLFEGNTFTSASLGFGTQLIYTGFDTDPDKYDEVYDSLLCDLFSESIRLISDNLGSDAKSAPVRNVYSKFDVLLKRAELTGHEELINNMSDCLLEFNDKRDREKIAEYTEKLNDVK